MRFVTDIEAASLANVRFVGNALARLEPRTEYEKTVRGRSRRYSYSNVLEMAFLHAFVRAGVRPSSAVAYAAAYVEKAITGVIPEWVAFPDGDPSRAAAPLRSRLTLAAVVLKDPSAVAYSFIPMASIKRHVDAYFAEHGQDSDLSSPVSGKGTVTQPTPRATPGDLRGIP